ncbi:MAG: flippase [Ruminococcaceae bacterium]|nr:flippase [Oscillospiraceae bacterium]
MKLSILENKEAKNAGWLIGGKVCQMLLSLVVGVLTARYLGPSNYGLINYGATYMSFFMAFCTLGINSVIISDFVNRPNECGMALGTSILLRSISSLASAFMIVGVAMVLDYGETETILVVTLCSLSLVFHAMDTINYWFQYQYKSKVTAIITFMAYLATSIYKIILLILKKNVMWFALSYSVDYIVLGGLLLLAYRKHNGPKLQFSISKGKELLSRSCHYILSGMMVAIYGQTDKLMLKQMVGETSVGYYSVATAICGMWVFVLQAIIDSMYPTIIRLYKEDQKLFEKKNRQLYSIIFYLSFLVSFVFLIFGDIVIMVLYGKDYMIASNPLKIITWYTAFSYLGVARNAWIVCKNHQKYLKYLYLSAAVINVILNFIMIPLWGISGAALASLITQIMTSIIFPLFIKALRPNAILMLEAITFRKIK